MIEKATILVVDDEHVIADSLAVILRNEGFHAKAMYSGLAAVQSAQESPPDALVCDILLGAESGIEVAIEVLTIRPDCRIILISGAQASSDLLERAGASGHEFEVLAKPFHPTSLIDRLRAYYPRQAA